VKEKQNKILIKRWFDRHLHVRDGEVMSLVLPATVCQQASGALIMPNLKYPDQIDTPEKVEAYYRRIKETLPWWSDFEPRLALYLTDTTPASEIKKWIDTGYLTAVKLYMADKNGEGGTTGSQHGVRNLLGRYPVFEMMEKHGIPLLGHFEAAEREVDEFDREIVSIERDLVPLIKVFPGLKVVFEHITDGRSADFVAEVDHPIYATATPQGMMINRNAMFLGGMNPGNYCKPVPKREEHRMRVRKHVTSGNPRFGAGTDSAPHDEAAKSHCYGCAAGIFTAPNAVELYTTIFDEDNALKHLGPFMSENFIDLYDMEVSTEFMTIKRESWEVPMKLGPVQIFKGGTTLNWKLQDWPHGKMMF